MKLEVFRTITTAFEQMDSLSMTMRKSILNNRYIKTPGERKMVSLTATDHITRAKICYFKLR